MIRWKLKQGREQSVRQGHPWILRDDLLPMGKSFVPGTFVEIVDHQDRFVGWGYGNHQSRIAVRMLSRKGDDRRNLSIDYFVERVLESWRKKSALGVRGSFRLVYSEGDFMPGLIADCYISEYQGGLCQIFCIQILTAGMERILADPITFFRKVTDLAVAENLTNLTWDQSVLVIRNDSNSRKHEGLEIEIPRVAKSLREIELNQSLIQVRPTQGDGILKFSCDLYQGQKTGFFLDQFQNITMVNEEIAKRNWSRDHKIRILDLCCYVGHWSVQLSHQLKNQGYEVEVTLVDVSQSALDRARQNVQRLGIEPVVLKRDVLKDLTDLPDNFYDVVIADPPAFAKSKRDAPQAEHAYMKLNTQSFRVTRSGGLMAACSCSGAVREKEFGKAVEKALGRSGRTARLIRTGGHAPDHPVLPEFPEGFYLKMNLFEVQ